MSDLSLSQLCDLDLVSARVGAAGLSATEVAGKAKRFVEAAEALLRSGANSDGQAFAYFVPGRIEVLGKHTDYAGGRTLVAATEKGFVASRSRVMIPKFT